MTPLMRPRRASWFVLLALVLLGTVHGCDCGPTGVTNQRYACSQDDECASGFVCRVGECRPEGEPVEEPDGGKPDGGGQDGGPPDGGKSDGGGQDGGPPDGGGQDGGPPDGGGEDAGTDPQPTSLAFITASQTLEAGQCSAAAVVETRTATGEILPVTTATSVSLIATPSPGFTFYLDSSCTTSTTQVSMEAGSSRATFHFKGTVAQTVRVEARGATLSPASQNALIGPAAPAVVGFVTPPQAAPPRGCSPLVELEAQDAYGNTNPFTTDTDVTLSVSPAGEFALFTDAACTLPFTTATIPAGSTRAGFYFMGKISGGYTVTATPSQGTGASQLETILPVVRRGTCSMSASASTVSCTISPPQTDVSKTLLIFQATNTANSPSARSVSTMCRLTARDTISCRRDNASGAMGIQWHTAELATGLKVQHLATSCSGVTTVGIPATPVANMANTFLLTSSLHGDTTLDQDVYYTAALTAADRVTLDFSEGCDTDFEAAAQVVEFEGASVTRGVTGVMTGTSLVVSGLTPVDLATTALLFTFRISGTDEAGLCDRVLRGELTSPTSITFSRGAGATTGCVDVPVQAISWERIDFGVRARAQSVAVSMANGTLTASRTLATPVDLTRTLAFSSSQAQCGQSGGETSSTTDDIVSASTGLHSLSSTTLTVNRGRGLGVAQWYSTVLQLEP
jgi:hypothetical protein